MLVQRLRRWTNINPALDERLLLASYDLKVVDFWAWLIDENISHVRTAPDDSLCFFK